MKLKVKTPKSIFIWILFFCFIALFFALFTGIITVTDVFFYLMGAILSWSFLIIFAIIGAIFFGMFLSHRILSIAGFTPFEEEMLKMREEMKAINEKLNSLVAQNNPGDKKEKEENEDD